MIKANVNADQNRVSKSLANSPIGAKRISYRTIEDYKRDAIKYQASPKAPGKKKRQSSIDISAKLDYEYKDPEIVNKEIRHDTKSAFLVYCKKLQHLLHRKYEELQNFLQENNGDTFFADTIDSAAIHDIL